MKLQLELPDGGVIESEPGVTGWEVARGIGAGLARAAVAVQLDDELLDLTRPLQKSGRIRIITDRMEEGREVLRHSAAHVLAQAVLDLYPGSTFAIGPAIQDGFYYDFGMERPFGPEDLSRLEERMAELIAADQPFIRRSMSREEALEVFRSHPFKVEIIES
ncbi:MAG: TGS domain-containing protein, partial [bacterium]|nr:TGS domain-containing protein [bacterium]